MHIRVADSRAGPVRGTRFGGGYGASRSGFGSDYALTAATAHPFRGALARHCLGCWAPCGSAFTQVLTTATAPS